MTAFRVEIPDLHLTKYPLDDMRRAEAIINRAAEGTNWVRWQPVDRFTTVFEGTGAPPHVVTLLGAMARGEPLAPILDAGPG